jgi:hypothetical protein
MPQRMRRRLANRARRNLAVPARVDPVQLHAFTCKLSSECR